RGPDRGLLARVGGEVDLLVERDVQRLQARDLPDLQYQRGRVGQAAFPVREMPDQAGAEREREQEGRHREQVPHRRSIPRGQRLRFLTLTSVSALSTVQ